MTHKIIAQSIIMLIMHTNMQSTLDTHHFIIVTKKNI